ncbi:hypothetical protein MML48_6g00015779 [Holotrichia oblita]|uniref:Uncharacterized protein n=1 Tax=Holotrichia oblita TaxID=644536 RepID=A0ACB9T054_HOLOL|nr:hypothetical protein MML48_6g00015779 [Holotrichia oblita]
MIFRVVLSVILTIILSKSIAGEKSTNGKLNSGADSYLNAYAITKKLNEKVDFDGYYPHDHHGYPDDGFDYGPPKPIYGPPKPIYGPPMPYPPPNYGPYPPAPPPNYGPPEPALPHALLGLLDKIKYKIDLLTIGKIILKLVIFKKIVLWIGIICLLLFLPSLKNKHFFLGSNNINNMGGDDDLLRSFNAKNSDVDERINNLGNFVMESIGAYSKKYTNDSDCRSIYCKSQRFNQIIDEKLPYGKLEIVLFCKTKFVNMSAAFKNAKKKLSQNELRKFMNEHKSKVAKTTKKIESPLAKYPFFFVVAGQLTCILCKSVVRSESVWNVHINAKQHKENVEIAKKLKERTNNFTTPLKRPLTPPLEVPPKKIKGILKNGSKVVTETTETEPSNGVPDDFFDSKSKPLTKNLIKSNLNKNEPEQMDSMEIVGNSETLPEGFFDDPKLDAKARNLEYKDPVEEEWERFQREIRDADSKSAAIIAEDQEEATNERQLDEIDEQMKNWSRVINLEKKKVEVIGSINDNDEKMDVDDKETSGDEDVDEFLDWRAKKSFK